MGAQGAVQVAILEDHRVMRESLTGVLEASGFQITCRTGDPEEFLASIADHPPQVAIIDLTLESDDGSEALDGISVLAEIREYHPDVRTLVLSATRAVEIVERCYREGACGYLYKLSASVDSVRAAVLAVAEGKRLFPFQVLENNLKVGPTPSSPNRLANLTAREREVLSHVAGGADNLKIATLLKITERTVKAHVSSLYRKLGPENRVELALLARHLGVRVPRNR